ncbi:Ankyrin [Thermaerobacter marianensis DSM 12885]|uniref:Ankyrin n=1 Tax=Thermaerobacter marianensis (strain ATCC 700841 / DSM 12885 / JCM 10246 / 7p75a) TaxID=644966 RepID=E6SKT5_THEM7|nr:ankyrin repeat domain-containing protein [Thermaerobacter marianensis]ADU52308.1 Ankyrin [Thermaerobacter marianensis DSM 12885]
MQESATGHGRQEPCRNLPGAMGPGEAEHGRDGATGTAGGPELPEERVRAILRAGRDGRRRQVLALLDGHPELARAEAPNGITPLHHAARYGWADVAGRLLELGADPNATNRWGLVPLHYAARFGHGPVASLLIEWGARPDVKAKGGQTPLDWAIVFGHPDVARLLVERGAQVGPFAAAGLGDLQRLEAWLQTDPGLLHARNDWKGTLLHVAALAGQRAAVRWLLDRGADPQSRDVRGRTPAAHAADPVIRRWLTAGSPGPAAR